MTDTELAIRKGTIARSPFAGIFGLATSAFTIVPPQTTDRERGDLEACLKTRIVDATVAQSGLWGVLAIGNKNGVLLPAIANSDEQQALEKAGIACAIVETTLALGNLIGVNDSIAIGPAKLPAAVVNAIEKKLLVTYVALPTAGFDLIGAGMVLTNRGWIASPRLSDEAFDQIVTLTKKTGSLTSAEYGDPWIGNTVLANDNGAIVAEHSTATELLHIDEGLSAASD